MRTAARYLADLDDGRQFWLDGARIDDVRTHPATRGAVRTAAGLFDHAAEHAHELLVELDGVAVNPVNTAPRDAAAADRRRSMMTAWARLSQGFLGRSPDHVAGLLAGFAAAPEAFTDELAANVVAYQRRVATEDLYLTYAIVPPQSDPSAARHRPRQVEVIAERDDGIVVHGAQLLATAAPLADEVFVTAIRPLPEGEEAAALSFALPVAAPGLRFVLRPPYAPGVTAFDHPLASRYDETDAMVVFDHVLVPWERLFVYRDRARCRAQFFDTPAHALANIQCLIRLAVKMRFVAAVAHRVAEVNGRLAGEHTMMLVSDVAALATVCEGLVEAAHAAAAPDRFGVWRPAERFLYAGMALQSEFFPRAVTILRELAGGGVLAVPSSTRDLCDPLERADLDLALDGGELSAVDRIRLFKLAWDVVGSEFAGRHVQYELFYSGGTAVVKRYNLRAFPFADAGAELDAFLQAADTDA
ncbi:MAG: 4-hydroxyphenylacetate 3-hydroxylase N-terminal domain-containing protein [Acidimicrobiia bacterium]